MRTNTLAVAAVLAAAALSANAATNRTEPISGTFTYEALGATPTLTFGRAHAVAPKAVEAPKPAAATRAAPVRAAGAAVTPLTYDALGATPHVATQKPSPTEARAPQSAR